MYTPNVPTENVTPIPFPRRRTVPAAKGLTPALIMIGIIIVPTRITIPRPFDAANIIEVTARNA